MSVPGTVWWVFIRLFTVGSRCGETADACSTANCCEANCVEEGSDLHLEPLFPYVSQGSGRSFFSLSGSMKFPLSYEQEYGLGDGHITYRQPYLALE